MIELLHVWKVTIVEGGLTILDIITFLAFAIWALIHLVKIFR